MHLFHCFIPRIGDSVSFLLHVSFPTGDEKVDHVDTKCIFICTSVGWVRGTVGSCMVQVFFTMAGLLKHVPKQECSQLSVCVLIGL